MNGEFVAWEDAKVHVLTHALHYGTGVFEGIRAYETDARHGDLPPQRAPRAPAPLGRALLHGPPVHEEELREATHELIARNGFKRCYIRPLVYRGYGPMGLDPLDNPVEASIAVWEWGAYLGDEGKENGIRAHVSSWRRISPGVADPAWRRRAGQYLNSVLAKIEATRPATRRRSCSTSTATSARARARTSSSSGTA